MLEASARRALKRLGWNLVRIAEGGYQVAASKGGIVYHFDDLASVERFILDRRIIQAAQLRQDGTYARTVEVPTRSFTKVVAARSVRFQCAGCGQWFEQERYPSRRAAEGKLYHSEECRKEDQRKKTRERVRLHRAGKKPQ